MLQGRLLRRCGGSLHLLFLALVGLVHTRGWSSLGVVQLDLRNGLGQSVHVPVLVLLGFGCFWLQLCIDGGQDLLLPFLRRFLRGPSGGRISVERSPPVFSHRAKLVRPPEQLAQFLERLVRFRQFAHVPDRLARLAFKVEPDRAVRVFDLAD